MTHANQQLETALANLDTEVDAAPRSMGRIRGTGSERRIEWHGLSFLVPSDWELVRHGSSPALGSLGFVDRRRERMTLSWAKTERVPDLERLTHELGREHSDSGSVAPFELGAFRGLVVDTQGGRETRAVTYHAESSRLLELRISETARGGSAETIVRSFRIAPSDDIERRWRAFGLDVCTPNDFALASAAVHPLDVTLRFERAFAGRMVPLLRLSARRLGMAATWFRGDFARLLAEKAPGVSFGVLQACELGDYSGFVATGKGADARWVRLVGRAREERALVFRAEDENAIYLYQSEGPVGRALAPQSFVPRADGAEP